MLRFFKDFFIYGIAGIIGKIAALFLMPLYTNVLTQEEYGAMALITACSGIIDLISNLNIHSGIARDYYETGIKRKGLVSTGFFSILIISLCVMATLLFTHHFWMEQVVGVDQQYELAFILMICTVPASSLQSYFSILTRFKKKPITYAIGQILSLAISITISIYGVLVMCWGIVSLFIGCGVSNLFSAVFFAIVNKEYINFSFHWPYLKRALLFSIPTLPAILASWLDNSIGQILIGKNISMEELGVYSIAGSLASAFSLIYTAFQNVWGPYIYENYERQTFKQEMVQLYKMIVIGLCSIIAILGIFSKEIVLILSNPNYIEASNYLILLCLPMCLLLLQTFASTGILVSRNTKHIGFANIIGTTINLVLLFVFTPWIGVVAVPLCLTVARVIAYFYLYYFSKKEKHYILPNRFLYILIITIVACYLIANNIPSIAIRSLILATYLVITAFYLLRRIKQSGIQLFQKS